MPGGRPTLCKPRNARTQHRSKADPMPRPPFPALIGGSLAETAETAKTPPPGPPPAEGAAIA
jgi:hypothetical protein